MEAIVFNAVVKSRLDCLENCRHWRRSLLIKILYIGIGGFIGSSLRYMTNGFIERVISPNAFPYGTFVVNILGCLVIGFLAGISDSKDIFSTTSKAFVFTGVLGAYTTFSTFSYETMDLFQNGLTSPALINLTLQIVFGLLSVWGGFQFAKIF